MIHAFTWIYYTVFFILSIIYLSNSLDDFAIDNFMSDQWHDIASVENNNVDDDVQITVYILDDNHNITSHNGSNLRQEKLEVENKKRPIPPMLMQGTDEQRSKKKLQLIANPNQSSQSTQKQKTTTEMHNQNDKQATSTKITYKKKKDLVERRQILNNDNKKLNETKKPNKISKKEQTKQEEEEKARQEKLRIALENKKKREEAQIKEQKERNEEIMKFLKPNMLSTRYIYDEIMRIERTHEVRDGLRKMVWFLERSFYKKYPLSRNVMKCYQNHIKSVHDALDLWNHRTNNLLYWPVRSPFHDIDFI
ncbi:inner centromere protein-like [Pectinophora gossypiella]|uniref:inner centromere protein-like n=1 Tax=Pectinophora gossypiella TaxID=13191 RepID=UPI00214E7824|nr:inner centromere protein-like [Pectinophora gossypiella]